MTYGIHRTVEVSGDDMVRSHRLLTHMNDIQAAFISRIDQTVLFEKILKSFLTLTGSAFGFIGEARSRKESSRFLKMLALSNIAWDTKTKELYIRHVTDGMELHDLNTLFGHVITSGEPVLSNSPAQDPRSKGLPHGHPPIEAFLGIPFIYAGQVIGMVGLANSPGGYETEDINYLNPLIWTSGSIIGAYEAERQRLTAQKALADSEALYQCLFENSHEGIGIIQGNRMMSANKTLLDIFGYKDLDEFVTIPVLDHVMPESRGLVSERLRQHGLDGHLDSRFRCGILRKDGSTAFIEASTNTIELGGVRYIVGTFSDISEKKRIFDKLLLSYEMLTTVLDSLNAIVYVSNLQTYEILYMNRYGREVFGDVEGEKCWKTLQRDQSGPCQFCDNHRLIDEQGMATGKIEYEFHNNVDGRWYAAIVQAITWVDGQSVRMEVATDVTERRRLQDEALRTSHLISIGELAAGVAHEINNHLSGIILNADALGDELNENGNKRLAMAAEFIRREASRLGSAVSSLLGFARIKDEAYSGAISMNDIVRELLALCEKQCQKDGIRFFVNVPEGLPKVVVSMNKTLRVLLNLFSNARYALNQKFPHFHEGKILELTCEQVFHDGTPFVRIVFHDKGIGISADLLEKVKNPFFTTKPRGQGTGLGLSISQSVLDGIGGYLSIESVEGESTTVVVDLPVR